MKTPSEAQQLLRAVESTNVTEVQKLLAQSKTHKKVYDPAILRLCFLSAINQQNKAILDSIDDCVWFYYSIIVNFNKNEVVASIGGRDLLDAVIKNRFFEGLAMLLTNPYENVFTLDDFSSVGEWLLDAIDHGVSTQFKMAKQLLEIFIRKKLFVYSSETLRSALLKIMSCRESALGYELCLLTDDIPIEAGKLYVKMPSEVLPNVVLPNRVLEYVVISPCGQKCSGNLTNYDFDMGLKIPLQLENVRALLPRLLSLTSASGHTTTLLSSISAYIKACYHQNRLTPKYIEEIISGPELIQAACQHNLTQGLELFFEDPFILAKDSIDFGPVTEYFLEQVNDKKKSADVSRLATRAYTKKLYIFDAETIGKALHSAVLNELLYNIIDLTLYCEFKRRNDAQFINTVFSFKKDKNLTAITAAISINRWDLVIELLECRGFCPDDTDNYPVALREAAVAGNVFALKWLLGNHASLELVTANPEKISTKVVKLIERAKHDRAFYTHLSHFIKVENEKEFIGKIMQFIENGLSANCRHQSKTVLQWLLSWSQHCKTPKQKTFLKILIDFFIQKGATISKLMSQKTHRWSTNILAIMGNRWNFLQYIYECEYLSQKERSEFLSTLQNIMRHNMNISSYNDINQTYFSHGSKIFPLLEQIVTTPILYETVFLELVSALQNGGSANCRREDSETPMSLIAGWSNANLSEKAFEDALKKVLFLFIKHGANVELLYTEQIGTIKRKIADVNEESPKNDESLPMLYPQSNRDWYKSFKKPKKITTSISPAPIKPEYIDTNPIKIAIDKKNWLFLKIICECLLIDMNQRHVLFSYMKNILLEQENGQLIIAKYLKDPTLSQQSPFIPQPSPDISEIKTAATRPEEETLSREGLELITLVDEVKSLWDSVKRADGKISSTTKKALSKCWETVAKIHEPLLTEIATNKNLQFFIHYMNVLKMLFSLGESSLNFKDNLNKETRENFLQFVISDETGGLTYTLVTHAKNLFFTNEDYTILARRRDAVWSNFIETMPAGEPSTLALMLRVANPASSLGRLFCTNFVINLPQALRFLQKKESNYEQKIKDRLALVKKSQPKEADEKNSVENTNKKK